MHEENKDSVEDNDNRYDMQKIHLRIHSGILLYFQQPGQSAGDPLDFPDADAAFHAAAVGVLEMAKDAFVEDGSETVTLEVKSESGLRGSVSVNLTLSKV